MDQPSALILGRALREFGARYLPGVDEVAVALSGGADSLALTAAAVAHGWRVTALVVDHGLQHDSAQVAAKAQASALSLGCVAAQVLPVTVDGPGGIENAARSARYAGLDAARGEMPVLLGHTLDDQAETVLLGLGRGSGGRSIAGMQAWDAPWGRPLLGVRRTVTREACRELSLTPWEDPHNTDSRFVRVRLRHEVLPLLEDVLGGGVAEALARTADSLRDDGDALDELAAAVPCGQQLVVADLAGLAAAVRRRVIRRWLLANGAENLSDKQIRSIDTLVTGWRGQGGVAVGSALVYRRLVVSRSAGALTLSTHEV